jgi:hypothetical protein
MRDDSLRWDPPSDDPLVYKNNVVTITQQQPKRQIVLSGANVMRHIDLPMVGWPGNVGSHAYALVLRRDRVLEINGSTRQEGWDETIQCAVSDMTDGYAMFTLEGQGVLELLKHGSFIDLENESRSVARLLFGIPAMLYRLGSPEHFAIHLERAHAQSMRRVFLSHVE